MTSGIHPSAGPANRFLRTVFSILFPLLIGACSLSTPYPNRSIFTINSGTPDVAATMPGVAAEPVHNVTLRVRRIIAIAPYGGSAFVYQSGPHSLANDYYNAFAAPPADLLSAQLVQWLRATRICADVTDGSGGVASQWALEGRLQELKIDATDPAKPQAVLQLQLVVLDESSAAPLVLLDKVYREQTAVSSLDPQAAAEGWSAACRSVFQQFSEDLRKIH